MGIEGYKFGLPKSAFATPEQNPQNECFCMFTGKKKETRCSISGTYDLGGCQAGAPLIVTRPHFMGTEPDLSKSVDGLNPNLAEHDTFLILEPVSLRYSKGGLLHVPNQTDNGSGSVRAEEVTV